ncbi:MAG: PD-(D/E)XK nuclease family protein [Comamonadaceae bacterium]|nr:PD-(D/E)XK nuclease family protein [Comamonadaceae bacterium]
MTKAYKEMSESMGLNGLKTKLASEFRDPEMKEDADLCELLARTLTLAEQYQKSPAFTPREMFEELWIEKGFDIIVQLLDGSYFRFKGFLDLVGKLKEPNANGKRWVLKDWKTGKGKGEEDSFAAAHSSLQLTLYWYVCTHVWGIPEEDLDIELHFLDDCVVAPTHRSEQDWNMLLLYVSQYHKIKDTPGIPPRLFFDSMTCQSCEYRKTCQAKFGYGTLAAEAFEESRNCVQSTK